MLSAFDYVLCIQALVAIEERWIHSRLVMQYNSKHESSLLSSLPN